MLFVWNTIVMLLCVIGLSLHYQFYALAGKIAHTYIH